MRGSVTLLPLLCTATVDAIDLDVLVVDRNANPIIDIPVKVEQESGSTQRRLEGQVLADLCFYFREVPSDQGEDFIWRTSEDGLAHLANLPEDRVLYIQAQRDGHASTITFDPASGEPGSPLLLLWDPQIPFSIPGQVVGWLGEPFEGATVHLNGSPGPRWMPSGRWVSGHRSLDYVASVTTDAQGRFSLPATAGDVGHPHWRLHPRQINASAPGHLTAYAELVGPLREVHLQLAPEISVMGTCDPGGEEKPILAMWMNGGREAVLSYGMTDYWGSGAVDDAGELRIETLVWGTVLEEFEGRLPQPVWLMLIRPGEGMAVRQFEITNAPNQEIDLGHLHLLPPSRLSCNVVNSMGEPLSGEVVHWLMPMAGSVSQVIASERSLRSIVRNSQYAETQIPPPRWRGTVGPDGRVDLSPLPEGPNRLLIGNRIVDVTLPLPITAEITVPADGQGSPSRNSG